MDPQHYNALSPGQVKAFANALNLRAQQRKSRCVSAVMADLGYSEKGVSFTDELLEPFEAEDFDGDIAPTPWKTSEQSRREARFRSLRLPQMVGEKERAEKLVDPTNAVLMGMAAALERKRDERITGRIGESGGIFGTSIEIQKNGDPMIVPFPDSQKIAFNFTGFHRGKADGVAAPSVIATVLSRSKLAQTKILLDRSFYADMTSNLPVVMLEETDLQNFATSEETINKDYAVHDLANLERLRNGEIGVYKGFRFVKVANGTLPRVPGQANRWYIPVFYPDVMIFKERPLITTRVETIQSMSFRWGAYYEAQTGSLRTDDRGMVWIEVER